MPRPHIPRVEVIAPAPTASGAVANVLTLVYIDGEVWAVTDYSVNGKRVDDLQTVTVTFLADVTVTHEREASR